MSLAAQWKEGAAAGIPGGSVDRRRKAVSESRKQREKALVRRRIFCCFLLVLVGVGGLLMLSLCLQVAAFQNEVRREEVRRAVEEERRAQEELRAEIARLESPARVEKEAAQRLGMVEVSRAEYLECPETASLFVDAGGDAPPPDVLAGESGFTRP